MKVDGDVVEKEKESSAEEENICHTDIDSAVFDETSNYHGTLSLIIFNYDEKNEDEEEADEGAYNWGGVPSFRLSTPLQGKDITNNSCHNGEGSWKVHLENLFLDGRLSWNSLCWGLEEDEDNGGGDSSNWEVDVKAPSPGNLLGKDSSEQWADDRCDTI